MGLRRDGTAMVHCRMSALGRVVGGAETVVRALLDALGSEGTLVAYTGWQDRPPRDLFWGDGLARDPDDEARRVHLEEHPAYDPRVALSRRDHGRVPEVLRTWPGSFHSGHPEAGVAAVGPLAEALTGDHPLDDAFGAGTPYARLVELGGSVLMLGAPLDTVTLVHHAEAVAKVPGKRRVSYRWPVLLNGGRVWRTFSDVDTSEGALPYGRVLGDEPYIEHVARRPSRPAPARAGRSARPRRTSSTRRAWSGTRSAGSSGTSVRRARKCNSRRRPVRFARARPGTGTASLAGPSGLQLYAAHTLPASGP